MFYYNLVRAANCTFKEAKEMPLETAYFYLGINQEIHDKEKRMLKDQERKMKGRR